MVVVARGGGAPGLVRYLAVAGAGHVDVYVDAGPPHLSRSLRHAWPGATLSL